MASLIILGLALSSSGCEPLFRDVDEVTLARPDASHDASDDTVVDDASTDSGGDDVADRDTLPVDPSDADTAPDADAGPCEPFPWYEDCDGDGVGKPGSAVIACDQPSDSAGGCTYVPLGDDCDDEDPNVWVSCGECESPNNDGYYTQCDAYVTVKPACLGGTASQGADCAPFARRDQAAAGRSVAVMPLRHGGDIVVGGALAAGRQSRFTILHDSPFVYSSTDGGSFVARYNNAGDLRWVRPIDGNGQEEIAGVSIGHEGRIFAGGFFNGTLEFPPSAEQARTLTSQNFVDGETDYANGFLAAYFRDGREAWITQIESTVDARITRVATASKGGPVAVGSFHTQARFPGFDAVELTSGASGGTNGFVAQWDPHGGLLWARAVKSSNSLSIKDVAVLPGGHIAIVGEFQQQLEVTRVDGNRLDLNASGSLPNGFILVMNEEGQALWGHAFGATASVSATAVAVLDTDAVAVAGTYAGVLFDPAHPSITDGVEDIYVAVFNGVDGTPVWSRAIGGQGSWTVDALAGRPNDDETYAYDGPTTYPDDVVAPGSLTLAGTFTGALYFGAGESNATPLRAQQGRRSTYVARFEESGTLQWARVAHTGGRAEEPVRIASAAAGSLVAVGSLGEGTVHFWADAVRAQTLSSVLTGDGFLTRIERLGSPCGDVSGLARNAPWPMVGYCPPRRGLTPFIGPPRGTAQSNYWPDEVFEVATDLAVAADGVVYLGTDPGGLLAIAPGQEFSTLSGPHPAGSSYVFDRDVTGDGLLLSNTHTVLVGMTATKPDDAHPHVGGLVAIHNNGNFKDYQVTASAPDGVTLYNTVMGSPVIDGEGRVFFTTNGSFGLQSINLNATGFDYANKWEEEIRVASSPTLSSTGRLYVVRIQNEARYLTAYDREGNLLCQSTTALDGEVMAAPVVTFDETVYVSTLSGRLYAIDGRDCSILGYALLQGQLPGRPALDGNGSVIVGTTSGLVYILDPTTAFANNASPLSGLSLASSPIVAAPTIDGTGAAYITATNGQVYHVDESLNPVGTTLYSSGPSSTRSPVIGPDGELILPGHEHIHGIK